ncbi:serine/threonine-protein kinase TBK1-like [Gigantopelta aegis]|uniref:serine/threonine-protein kinase TBK1-like n=1 Tax=Gigantopelta aegis TaxID=1735272 RepID=UPI001B889F26|nr:serine/threonine-protein kinase TBK1-like [Gigantopelta aegis]XP_041350010.1 serine/threonine-protein kinase TBK1-like [Gigantopelta aegis]XP_041350011.1 serine/threonine-protein kinase TBK1-like [Gigantopelta aegis]XP_041350013.1 serine/threonine-protein kinase TBK1-like [Gigantopelta aegis]XP_041350014.1 serine/threonine-protein kinase TBK1-like [Gigantopelta aegis]XP_041350015.1 serine/threonine-protein kinase TBK1-like [Gigantopelta aegis]
MGPLSPIDAFGATTTHVYNRKEKLGVGASCEVFRGIQRNSGTTHALKIFKDGIWSNSCEHQREVEALSKLKHPNIVALHGREKELETGRTVLVMELCQGGSLHTFLQEPENMHGLGEKEFFIFISDTCAGLKHLRSCGFVHRDIKPGNILRTVLFDGTVRYKISDFGSSKNLEHEEGEFMSLAGTEEYLHPAMYVKAFVKRDIDSSFNNTVDLWSLGCTIYHACTGEIPFKPHGGVRHNRNIMYIMITCKPSDAISGSQRQEDADIAWQNELPKTCPMATCVSLRLDVQKMIAGLVEANKTRQWTFETFERSVQHLTSMKKICVVNTDKASLHDIYVSPLSSFKDFHHCVDREINTDSSSFLLFHKNKQLPCSSDVSLETVVANNDTPVILIHKTNGKHVLPHQTDPFPSFTSSMTMEEEIKTARKDCWAVSNYGKLVKSAEWIHKGLIQAREIMCSEYKEKRLYIQKHCQALLDIAQEKRSLLEMIGEWEGYRRNISQAVDVNVSQQYKQAKSLCLKIHNSLYEVQESLRQYSEPAVLGYHTGQNGISLQPQARCEENTKGFNTDIAGESDMSSRAQHLFEESKSIWRRMKQRQQDRPISEFEEMMHKKDKKDLQEICAYAVHLWQDFRQPKTQILYDRFIKHKTMYFQRNEDLTMIEQQLMIIKVDVKKLTEQLSQIWAFSGKAWSQLTDDLSISKYSSKESAIVMKENDEIRQKSEALLKQLKEVKMEDDLN